MKKYSTICALFFVLFFLLIININIVNADGFLPIPNGGKEESGNYTLNDIVSVAVIVANWMLGVVGSLALVMFIYGGVVFLLSRGNSDQVKKGQEIILGAVTGLVIVFASHAIIQLVFTALGINGSWSATGWF